MARMIRVAAAQMGPIARSESRPSAVRRLMALIEEAHGKGCQLVVFPELALTTFFPRWYMEDQNAVDAFFEKEMPNRDTKPLFELAAKRGVGFYLGYGELVREGGAIHHYNTSVLVDRAGKIVGKYRKVHLPGHSEYDPKLPWQHLEKRYFEPGNLGFPVWRTIGGIMGMCICNDRRWPETYRVLGLQGVELVMLGYNTPTQNSRGPESPEVRMFHNHVTMQAGAYQNGTWVVGTAKAGNEEGVDMMAGSCIIAPDGQIVAKAKTAADELVVADCDLDACQFIKTTIFNFAAHRRIEHYKLITERTGAIPPPE